MRKINSFTIIELVMSLLISGIVIGIVYYAFLFFNRQNINYQYKSRHISEYFLFNKSMLIDFEKAELIRDSLENFLILRNKIPDKTIIYSFSSNIITRQTQESIDSFSLACEGFHFYYLSGDNNIVNKAVIKLNINDRLLLPIFLKSYSAAQILDAETKNYE